MALWYVTRDPATRALTGLYARPQDQAAERIDDAAPEAVAFLNPDLGPALRAAAVALLSDPAATPKALRGTILALLAWLNQAGAAHNSLLAWLGGQTALANRAQLNGLTLPPALDLAAAKAAIANQINGKGAD